MPPAKTSPPPATSDLTLAETLRALRSELELAKLESAGSNLLFQIDRVDVEFKVQISNKTGVNAGIDFHIVKAGTKLDNAQESTHTIKLTLKVADSLGRPVKVAGHTPGHNQPIED